MKPIDFISRIALLSSLSLILCGTKACQEDYNLAAGSNVPNTGTPTASPTATDQDSETETPTVTATPTITQTPNSTITIDFTPTPTKTITVQALQLQLADELNALGTMTPEPTVHVGAPTVLPGGNIAVNNWIGQIGKKDSDNSKLPAPKIVDRIQNDKDFDGISDQDEVKIGTNPLLSSTTSGCPDGAKVLSGANPLSAGSIVANDRDGDCLSDDVEARYGTNPSNKDTDNDGLSDFDEIVLGTNSRNPDTNGNGIKDGEEVKNGIDPGVKQ